MLDTNFWRKYFRVYDFLNNLIPYNDLLNTIINHAEIKSGDLVLDAGSGTGNLAIKLTEKGAIVIGIDSSREGIELHTKKQPQTILIHGDLTENLPFPDERFDKICTNNTLYTISPEKRQSVINEFHRILKKDGIIVISNLREGFKPIAIYKDHIKISLQKNGLFETLSEIFRLCIPTIKIFYYNYLIKKENKLGGYKFMTDDDQKKLLTESGFINISDNIMVYSGYGILNKAYK